MYNIAIDGPAGAGKSTIAKIVAKELGFIYVDTGAMYRTMALACHREGISAKEHEKVAEKCESVDVSLGYEDGTQKVFLNGEDVSTLIRQEEIGNMTSAIAVYPEVRKILVEMQTVAHQFRIRHVYQICVLIFFSKTFHGGFHFAAILFVLLGYRTENKR